MLFTDDFRFIEFVPAMHDKSPDIVLMAVLGLADFDHFNDTVNKYIGDQYAKVEEVKI